jgi:hypothetical protein
LSKVLELTSIHFKPFFQQNWIDFDSLQFAFRPVGQWRIVWLLNIHLGPKGVSMLMQKNISKRSSTGASHALIILSRGFEDDHKNYFFACFLTFHLCSDNIFKFVISSSDLICELKPIWPIRDTKSWRKKLVRERSKTVVKPNWKQIQKHSNSFAQEQLVRISN